MNNNGILNLQSFRIKRRYGDKAQCTCPAHDDRQASLTITKGQKCTLFCCHAGCTLDDILRAAGLEKRDTFYDTEPRSPDWKAYVEGREKRKIEAVYNYVFLDGCYAFTKLRLEGKKLLYGKLTDGRFTYGLGGNGRKDFKAVYGDLQAIKKAIAGGKPIFVPEGEKDVDTLVKHGYAAFTYGGTNDWQSDFATLVKEADVYVLADNDEPGKRVAEAITHDLEGIAKKVRITIPTPDIPKGDISDYFAAGHSKEKFEKLIQDEFKESIESIADNEFKENKEFKRKPGELDRFHLFNDNGKITGVFDYAIFEYLKSKHELFVLGGTPYLYDGGVYVPDETGAKLKTMIRGLIYPAYIKSTTIKRIYELFISAAELQATFEDVNQYPPHWVNFQNGFFDPKTGRMVPHDPKYKALNQLPHKYEPEAMPKGETVEAWLRFSFPEPDDREMLLQYEGLTGSRDVSQQKFLVFDGEGGSGKSTVIRMNEYMVGSRNVSNISLSELQQRFASFGLMGKLLNSCADLEIAALEDTSTLKKCLGEDTLRGEQKGKDAVSFKSYARLIFSTNELPLVKAEKTNGFYRRLLVLPMNRVPEKKDADLFVKLSAEIDYFIHLSMDALQRMYKTGAIAESRASVAAVNQLRCDSDTVEAFLNDVCSQDTKERVERTELYEHYIRYCEETDRQGLTKNNFYKSLRVKGYREIKTGGYRYFEGISLMKNCPKSALETALDGFITVTEEEMKDIPFN